MDRSWDIITAAIHTFLSGVIYTFFIYMYFQFKHSLYIGFAFGLSLGLYILYKEKTEENVNPIFTIYFIIPVILVGSPIVGWIFESSYGNIGYYFGYIICAFFVWFTMLYKFSDK